MTPITLAIVDDDDDVRNALEAMLDSHGYRTVAFASAESLLAYGGLADLACIITDVQMPGISGLDMLAALPPAVPVIVISAFTTPAIERQAEAAGARRFLTKPFQPADLLAALRASTRAIG